MPTTDEFGGISLDDELEKDDFGGVAIQEETTPRASFEPFPNTDTSQFRESLNLQPEGATEPDAPAGVSGFFGDASTALGDVFRAVPADVANIVSKLKRPSGFEVEPFPTGKTVQAVKRNFAESPDFGGNIKAALSTGELPIDTAIEESALESKDRGEAPVAATVAHLSQGLAATAPVALVIGGLPSALQKVALAAFTGKMLYDTPEIATQLGDELGKNPKDQDPNKVARLVSDAIQVTGFSALGLGALAKMGLPRATQALKSWSERPTNPIEQAPSPRGFEAAPERTPNASTITSTEGLPQPEVWTPVGEEAWVRQQGQTAGTQVKTEVSPPPAEQVRAEVTPDIVQFGQDFAAGKKISTEAAVGVGLKAKSIADLEALMEIQAKFKEEVAQARQRVKSATTPAEQQAALQEAVIKGTSAQLPREAIEGAVNAGSNAERGNIKFGERPLDWRKNPEVAEWLKKNGEKIGIKLPDELKSETPTTQIAATPEGGKKPQLPKQAWFTPQIGGKQTIAEFQSSGLPAGKFYALDKPFESDAHDIAQARKVDVPAVKKTYDPDGLIGPKTENLHEQFIAEENKVKMPKGGYGLKELRQIRQRFSDFLTSKGYDSYVRGIDGNPKDRELIVLDSSRKVVTPSTQPPPAPAAAPAERQLPQVEQYINAIKKNPAKKKYVQDYRDWVVNGKQGEAPNPPAGMADYLSNAARLTVEESLRMDAESKRPISSNAPQEAAKPEAGKPVGPVPVGEQKPAPVAGEKASAKTFKEAETGKPFRMKLLRGQGAEQSPYSEFVPQEPILGKGTWTTPSKEYAQTFGNNITEHDVSLENPLVIRTDDQWRSLTKEAGWKYSNPFGQEISATQKNIKDIRALIESKGHDGVVIEPSLDGDAAKVLWDVFGEKQVVEFKKQPSRTVEESGETQGAIAASTPLTPSTTTTTLTPKSQRQIITDLAKGLNLPIRFGRLTTSKFAGYFKPRANLIGSKRAVDVPTVSHEAGHKLDDTLKLSSDKSIASELDVLGDPATPGSGSSWTPSKTKKYKMGEGVAEFVRYWLTDPAKALKDAPNTHAAFEAMLNANKDFGDVMRQAQEDIKTWRESEPQARLRSHISTDNPNKTRYTLSQLTRDLVDDLHILRLAVDEAKKSGDLPPSKDPYLAARNLRGSYGMADTFIRNGVADFNTKEVKLGTSLEDALKPIAGRLSDFRDWIVAKRAQELRGQGKETGLIASDVDTVVKKFQNDAAFQKAFDDIKTWNDSTLQYAVDAGLITPESAAAMRKMNLDYVPFSRLFEVGAGEAPSQQSMGVGTGLNVGKPGSFKRLTGSTREIVDPIETMIKNAYTIITASEKAAINRSVAEMSNLPNMGKWVERVATPKEGVRFDLERVKKQLEDAGADLTNVPDDLILSFFRQSGRAPFGENIIRVIRNGKPEFYRLNRDLHDTFQALDLEDSGKLVRILSAPAQLLRAGVVLEPSFNVANALRDTFSAAVISKYGALPFETTLKGVAAMIKNPQAVAEWAAAGGKNSVEANFFDRTKMQKFLTEKIAKDLTPAERALVVTKSPLTALRWLTSKAEEATRIGEYQIAYKKLIDSGMPEGDARRLAAFESRDRQDFAKGGAKTKIIRHMSAFWNASLQANVKLAQAFKERPGKTLLAGLAFVTIPKLLEQAVNWDDKDYWDRPQWERDMFFMIPVGKDETNHTKFLRIPTPFEVGLIFGTFPGRLLQWLKTNKPESVSGFPQMMLKQSVPNPIPQTLQVTFEDFLSGEKGWDIWRGRTVVPESLADLPADLQWTDQTSGLAKRVGQALNYSPMKVDHIIERTTGGLGKLATGKQYPGQRFMAAPLRISNEPLNDFYEQLGELRKQNAASKLDKQIHKPAHLAQFEKTARELSELRDKARKAQTDAQKAVIQEQIFQKAKGQVEKYGNNL